MFYQITALLAGCIVAACCTEYVAIRFDDPREPPRVKPRIPVIGHLLGWLWHGFDYLNRAGQSSDAEIYTVGIFNFKVYVTHAPRLLNVMQKSKTLSVKPILQDANRIHSGASSESHALFDGDLLEDFRVRTREALVPSLHLDEQNLRMGNQSVTEVTDILKRQGRIELLSWVKHVILQSTSAGFYGMQHPFRDPEMETAMWDWDKYRPAMHIKTDPFGKGAKARAKVFEALKRYFQDVPEDVSQLVRERRKALEDGGIGGEDALKMQAFLNDGNFNIVPTLYWTIYEIFSRPELLEAIRQEVAEKAVQRFESGNGDHEFILDMSAVKTKCPLLLAAYQETQRTRHMLSTSRMVLEDTLLGGQYLLKKGNLLYLPARPIHHNTEIWGPRAAEFDPQRFMPGEPGIKPLPSNFLPWGSAPYICPTRQFISAGILVLVALMVSRVHFTPANGRKWEDEPATRWVEIATLPTAREEVFLTVTPRAEGAGKWTVVTGRAKTAVPIISG